jgi:hypothetical protein
LSVVSGRLPDVTGLARRLGTPDAVVLGLGAMLGAGVFSALGPAARVAGSALRIGRALAAVGAECEARASAQRAAHQAQQRPAPPQRQVAHAPAQQRQPAQARRTASAHEPRGRRNAKDKNDDDKGHPRGG